MFQLLGEIKKLDFILNGRQVKYDDNYDPSISYKVVLWHTDVNPPQFEMVGTYDKHPEITFTMDNSLLPWHNNGSVFYYGPGSKILISRGSSPRGIPP
ncbi:hypothetical protein cypCar_00047996 [Cyprinus carpio]|nr:hypothetical protein cypCar_00047996 [Cyprinus carpio]